MSDDSVVDIDWLTQQGLQVVVADTDDQRWHRQMVGVDDGRALAQLVGKKVRARPEKHLVASDDLQELINNLKPDDSMGNHVDIVMRMYTPHEGLNVANQKSRKLGVFGWKLEGSNSQIYNYNVF